MSVGTLILAFSLSVPLYGYGQGGTRLLSRMPVGNIPAEPAKPPASQVLSVLELSDEKVTRHDIDFGAQGVRSGSFPARSYSAMFPEEAWRDSIFEPTTENMDAKFSDLASSLSRTCSVTLSGSDVILKLSKPSRFFLKSALRAYYKGLVKKDKVTGKYAPIPLFERSAEQWRWFFYEPRTEAGGWYPLRDYDEEVHIRLATGFQATWARDRTSSGFFVAMRGSAESKPQAIVNISPVSSLNIPDLKLEYSPPKPKAWIVVCFQQSTSSKLRSIAKTKGYGICTLALAGRRWSRHQAALLLLHSKLWSLGQGSLPIVPVGFSAGGSTAFNAANWFPEFVPGAVVDGHTDLAESDDPWSLRSPKSSRIALLTGEEDGMVSGWNEEAHRFGLLRGQPRFLQTHKGGHTSAPIADYESAIEWVLAPGK